MKSSCILLPCLTWAAVADQLSAPKPSSPANSQGIIKPTQQFPLAPLAPGNSTFDAESACSNTCDQQVDGAFFEGSGDAMMASQFCYVGCKNVVEDSSSIDFIREMSDTFNDPDSDNFDPNVASSMGDLVDCLQGCSKRQCRFMCWSLTVANTFPGSSNQASSDNGQYGSLALRNDQTANTITIWPSRTEGTVLNPSTITMTAAFTSRDRGNLASASTLTANSTPASGGQARLVSLSTTTMSSERTLAFYVSTMTPKPAAMSTTTILAEAPTVTSMVGLIGFQMAAVPLQRIAPTQKTVTTTPPPPHTETIVSATPISTQFAMKTLGVYTTTETTVHLATATIDFPTKNGAASQRAPIVGLAVLLMVAALL